MKAVVDHRTYTIKFGHMAQYVAMYQEYGYPCQVQYLGQPIGWYTSTDIGMLNQVVHLWGYDSLQERAEKRARMKEDPRWKVFLEKILPLIITQENKILSQPGFIQN
ncbi:MAG: hypothetical protein RLZZ502_1426 [Pseudomonadota bacterium]|jgi:hypothetical protein